jgi:hypothetical protein
MEKVVRSIDVSYCRNKFIKESINEKHIRELFPSNEVIKVKPTEVIVIGGLKQKINPLHSLDWPSYQISKSLLLVIRRIVKFCFFKLDRI